MRLIELLQQAKIGDLQLPEGLKLKLVDQQLTDLQKMYASIQAYRAFGKCNIEGLTNEDMQVLHQHFSTLLVKNGLMKPKTNLNLQAPIDRFSQQHPPIELPPQATTESNQPVIQEPATTPVAPRIDASTDPDQSQPRILINSLIDTSPLKEFEERFARLIKEVELVGEIPITPEELATIASHFGSMFINMTEQNTMRVIEAYFPATFLVYLVGEGIYGYGPEGYWPVCDHALGRDVDTTAFGRLFERLLLRFGKSIFRNLQEMSFRYVSLILFHGGIPNYCLKDFFDHIVLNSSVRPQLMALDGVELVEEVLKHSSYTTNTDKPVLYFLEYGGKTAADILDRTRRLLNQWQLDQPIPLPDEVGLPQHIINSFASWVQESKSVVIETKARNRLKKPSLCLDPWGLGVFLSLPSQPVSATRVGELSWKVDGGSYKNEFPARTLRKADQIFTRDITIRLSEITEQIFVQFRQGTDDNDWKITGHGEDHLVMAFDPANGRLLNHIQAGETWLLYPEYLAIGIENNDSRLLEILPSLPGEWSRFKAECWDLAKAESITLLQNGELFREISIRTQEEYQPPYLDMNNIVPTDLEELDLPLYVGQPPRIHIPLNPSQDVFIELNRWNLQIINENLADPERSFQKKVSDLLKSSYLISNNEAIILLSDPSLLTNRPCGTYKISLQGPLGRDASFAFQIMPEFSISGMQDTYIPDPVDGPQSVQLTIQTSLLDVVESLSSASGVLVAKGDGGRHQITVPAQTSSVGLLIRREAVDNQYIHIPVNLRINRMRWRIVLDNGVVEAWSQKKFTMSVPELLQEHAPLFIVDLPFKDAATKKVHLSLIDVSGDEIQQIQPAEHNLKRINRFWRFELDKIKHILDVGDSSTYRLDLVISTVEDDLPIHRLPAVVFTRSVVIADCSFEVQSDMNYHNIRLMWNEKRHVRSRALVIWSQYRPWQPPILEKIPDSACGEYEFRIPREGNAEGIYKAKFIVLDPWIDLEDQCVVTDKDKTDGHVIKISPPEQYLEKLKKEIRAATYTSYHILSDRLEYALILSDLGRLSEGQYDIEACTRNLLEASTRELLTLQEIITEIDVPVLKTSFGNQIIQPDVIHRIVKDLESDEINDEEFINLFKFVPKPDSWSQQSCEVLVYIEDPKIRYQALTRLAESNIGTAVPVIVDLVDHTKLALDDAVEILFLNKVAAVQELIVQTKPVAKPLLELLRRFNPYAGAPLVKVGSWVQTNAGWGKIETIIDPRTRESVDSFVEGDQNFILSVALNIPESFDLMGEPARIDMVKKEISLQRASKIFLCSECNEFATSKVESYRNHLIAAHGNALPHPGVRNMTIPLTKIVFSLNLQQRQME